MQRPYRVEVLVDAPAATVRDRIGRWCTVEEVDAGHCRVRMTSDDLAWPAMALGVVGAGVHVLEPPELRTELRSWATRFLRA
jgi:predicted DNA-binding transcriptional regulator YafY